MNLLAVDTRTEHPSIALAKGEETWVGVFPDNAKTSANIVPLCLQGLKALSLSFASLNAIVYTKGPGAFTGLRTAVSLAQGFSLARPTPTLGFSTLLTLAQNARSMGHLQERVVCALDARMQQVYWGTYHWEQDHWACLKAPSIESELASHWPRPWEDCTSSEPTLVVGNGTAVKEHQALTHLLPHSPLTWCVCEPHALALLALAQQHFAHLDTTHSANRLDPTRTGLPSPWYLRDQVAQTTKERALARETAKTQAPTSMPTTPAVVTRGQPPQTPRV